MTTIECAKEKTLRVATYNVHGCAGATNLVDPMRTAAVLAELDADIIALQEVDNVRGRSGGVDQAGALAQELGYFHAFCAAQHSVDSGGYGNAVLSRWPIVSHVTLTLPGVSMWRAEPRCAVEAVVATPWGELSVWGVHLGVRHVERARQTSALIGRMRRAIHGTERLPLVLLGDLNAGPSSRLLRSLGTWLVDARDYGGGRTFPSSYPLFAIDHVLVSPPLCVAGARAHRSAAAVIASDHLPFVADLNWHVA
ncbi:MAG: EEP domain-containing protein [Polyangiaceae bacterium]|nr:EEP domain-containing protein [Polyangiaceae bacterium]